MLILTFVSRMVYTESMPRVSCMQIKNQSISHELEYGGTVEALKSLPIFVPEGFAESFAQMPAEQKNSMSHRARAAAALNEYLQTL